MGSRIMQLNKYLLMLSLLVISIKASSAKLPAFGRTMREEFLFKPEYINLNHGAYGTYPRAVQTALHDFQLRSESNADLWIRREARVELDIVRKQLAQLINCDPEDLVVVPNTTGGMNAIFRSMVFQPGERILHFSNVYGAMGSLIKYICDYSNGTVTSLEFPVIYPMSNEKLIKSFEEFLDAHHNPLAPIRLALVDHISSTPAVVLPIQQLIPILKKRNILSLIDGAHAVGQVSIDIAQLAPDYYITNCHKWLYAARGCSMMYVEKSLQDSIHPAQISSNYNQPSQFQDEFFWTGTMDYSPYMTVTAALEFRRAVGGEAAIRNYTHKLAVEGAKRLIKKFNTTRLQVDDEQIGSMVDVQLPLENPHDAKLTSDFWIDTLLYKYNVYCSPYKHNDVWWIRVSAQIYNDESDFDQAGVVFQEICDGVNRNASDNGSRVNLNSI